MYGSTFEEKFAFAPPTRNHHSTGPRTAAGIENCKYNATKHGLTGNQVVIRGEDPAEYDSLRAALIAEHNPVSEGEAMLVERIAQNWWKLQRAERYERDLFDRCANEDVFSSLRLHHFIRYRVAIERAWNRARRELLASQTARAEAARAAAQ